MCIQRIQSGKLDAKKRMEKLKDGEIKTACAQSCPTNAIVFGDYNNEESELAKMNKDERAYHVLEEIGIKPSVIYMTKVRNTEPAAAPVKEEAHHEEHNEA